MVGPIDMFSLAPYMFGCVGGGGGDYGNGKEKVKEKTSLCVFRGRGKR